MFFVTTIRKTIIVASPFLLHLFMIVAVGAYTAAGAYIMQWLENQEIYRINAENGHMPRLRERRDFSSVILSGKELAAVAQSVHPCVREAMESLRNVTRCNAEELEKVSIAAIDDCYRNAKISVDNIVTPKDFIEIEQQDSESDQATLQNDWNLPNAIIFAFTVITTIGYGHIAPATTAGRVFCVVFGLIGIPLALLTIADIGMFLNRLVKKIVQLCLQLKSTVRKIWMQSSGQKNTPKDKEHLEEHAEELSSGSETESERNSRSGKESLALAIIFLLYLLLGSLIISSYEVDMDFFKALYFNYVTITTIGLGDIVPKNYNYLYFTFIYITVGLALTTMAVEIAADYLKKLHYFGRKVGNVAKQDVWFGGKKMKLKNLIRHLGDQLNIPIEELENLNIDSFVQSAIQVVDGEKETLRKPPTGKKPISFEDLRKEVDSRNINYADE